MSADRSPAPASNSAPHLSIAVEDLTDARPVSAVEADPFRSENVSPRPQELHTSPVRSPSITLSQHMVRNTATEKQDSDGHSSQPFNRNSGSIGHATELPLPALPSARLAPERPSIKRQWTTDTRFTGHHSTIDHLVPVSYEEKPRTYESRIQPTIDVANTEKKKYEAKAKITGYSLNIAIGLQVLLGSLTTGLSAVATSGKSAAVSTTILGALSTITASYLAKARGSNEPELSITRVKDLEHFIRDCEAFRLDYGHLVGTDRDQELIAFRRRFEELLGNANGERKLSPPV